jgi:hypothetical protein
MSFFSQGWRYRATHLQLIGGTAEPVVVSNATPAPSEVATENPSDRTAAPVASGERNLIRLAILIASGIPLLTGTNATGTSQFGNDGCYQYGQANQVPIAAGYWGFGAGAGVFYRNFTQYRSGDASYYGFRCAAY